MTRAGLTNPAASVHRRLLNLSQTRGENFNFLLVQYALERFLYRLAQSGYAHQFVLKGALLFVIWRLRGHRPTRDLDLLGYGDSSVVLTLLRSLTSWVTSYYPLWQR